MQEADTKCCVWIIYTSFQMFNLNFDNYPEILQTNNWIESESMISLVKKNAPNNTILQYLYLFLTWIK